MARRPGVRSTPYGHRLAAPALSRPLATAEPATHARPSNDCQGAPRAHPGHVAGESHVGLATDRRGTAETGHRGGQVDGGEVSGAASEAAITDVEDLPEEPRAGSGVPRFLCRADGHPQSAVRPAHPGP